MNHLILPERVQKDKIKTNGEKLVHTLKRNTDITVNEELRDEFKFLVKRFTNDTERDCSERANQSQGGVKKLKFTKIFRNSEKNL